MIQQRVFVVSPNEVSARIPDVEPWLEKMAFWTRGRRRVEDIVLKLLKQETNLWITLSDAGLPNGALVTKIEQYPRLRMLHVLHCAGEKGHMEEVADTMYAALDAFAMFNHCAGVEFIGRPGWERHVKARGFSARSVMYQKFFEGTHHA